MRAPGKVTGEWGLHDAMCSLLLAVEVGEVLKASLPAPTSRSQVKRERDPEERGVAQDHGPVTQSGLEPRAPGSLQGQEASRLCGRFSLCSRRGKGGTSW